MAVDGRIPDQTSVARSGCGAGGWVYRGTDVDGGEGGREKGLGLGAGESEERTVSTCDQDMNQYLKSVYVAVVRAYSRSMQSPSRTITLPPIEMVDQMADEIVKLRKMMTELLEVVEKS